MPIITKASQTRRSIRTNILLFIGINGLLSVLFYFLFESNQAFVDWNPIWKASALGFAYPALIRSKFATLTVNSKDIPIGLDLYYEKIRKSFYRRIDKLVRDEEYEAVKLLAAKEPLNELFQQARFSIDSALAQSNADKEALKSWCDRLETDQNASDEIKKLFLANFLLHGRTQKL